MQNSRPERRNASKKERFHNTFTELGCTLLHVLPSIHPTIQVDIPLFIVIHAIPRHAKKPKVNGFKEHLASTVKFQDQLHGGSYLNATNHNW